jgi:two-component system, OmpR family, response regulator ChvI
MSISSRDSSVYIDEDVKRQNTQILKLENIKINEEQITFINYTHRYCVCVIDIVDSTKTTSKIEGSEKIREFYSIFLNTMASVIKTHNGKVIKNAGDCLIYYFPKTVDGSNESAFRDVIDCGVAMIDANPIINSRLNQNDLPSISYRISANYGIMELAVSLNSNNVDLFGPTLNICSKINHLSPPNGMVIYKDLYDILSENPDNEEYFFKEIQCNNDDKEYNKYSEVVYLVHRIENPRGSENDGSDSKRQKHNTHQQQLPQQQKQQPQQRQQKNELNQANSSYNILLIDDDTDILFTFTAVIEGEGYHLKSFNNPYEALNHFSQMDPYYYDLVIMDIRMPGMNGIQLYSKLKVMNPEIKVLFLSALDAVEELLSIFPDIKINEIIRKPIEPRKLISKASAILKL